MLLRLIYLFPCLALLIDFNPAVSFQYFVSTVMIAVSPTLFASCDLCFWVYFDIMPVVVLDHRKHPAVCVDIFLNYRERHYP